MPADLRVLSRRDLRRAQILHQLLLPYADLTVVVGSATVCLGATSRS